MTGYNYLPYKAYIYNSGENKKYRAVIRKADGSYVPVKPVIYTKIDIAIAGVAIAGVSRAG